MIERLAARFEQAGIPFYRDGPKKLAVGDGIRLYNTFFLTIQEHSGMLHVSGPIDESMALMLLATLREE